MNFAGSGRRLGFRSLLRSMGGSSTSLQQIAQGQPRPCDVAPPSPTAEGLAMFESGPLASPGPVVSPGRLPGGTTAGGTAGATQGSRTLGRTGHAPGPGRGYYNVDHPADRDQQPAARRHSVGSFMHSARARTPALPTAAGTSLESLEPRVSPAVQYPELSRCVCRPAGRLGAGRRHRPRVEWGRGWFGGRPVDQLPAVLLRGDLSEAQPAQLQVSPLPYCLVERLPVPWSERGRRLLAGPRT